MSKGNVTLQVPGISDVSRDHSYRHSLQPKGVPEAPALRHTQSHNYGTKKKRVKVPPIPESEADVISLEVINERVRLGDGEKKRRSSKTSRKNSQASTKLGLDNAGFEGEDGVKVSRVNSAASSVRSSMRDPSVQSLTVVREQYCCCTKWTPCERTLFAVVGVLAFIIIILVIVVAIIASGPNEKQKSLFSVFSRI